MKALAVEVWGQYTGLVLRDENFGHILTAAPELKELEEVEKADLRDEAWLANARAQVSSDQLYESQSWNRNNKAELGQTAAEMPLTPLCLSKPQVI